MTKELVHALSSLGLSPKISKARWTSDTYEDAVSKGERLYIGDEPIAPSEHLKVLGSMISGDRTEREMLSTTGLPRPGKLTISGGMFLNQMCASRRASKYFRPQ